MTEEDKMIYELAAQITASNIRGKVCDNDFISHIFSETVDTIREKIVRDKMDARQ